MKKGKSDRRSLSKGLTVLMLLLPGVLVAQITFKRTFGGPGWDDGRSVWQTTDGGYIIAGSTESYGAGKVDVWLIKTDSKGNKEWDRTFGGIYEWDRGYSVQQTSDGGYIITGCTNSHTQGGPPDLWLIKTDSKGNKEWDRTFGGTRWDKGHSVQQTTDGGYIVAGITDSYGAGSIDVWLIKTDSKGNREWDRTFGGISVDIGCFAQQTTDGGYIIAGFTASYGAGEMDIWLIKTDSKGDKEWDRTFGGAGYDDGLSVQQTIDGGYIIAGRTESYGAGEDDIWLIKTDSKGDREWDKTFGGRIWDGGFSVRQTADGGYIVAGYTASYGLDYSTDIWLIKTDSKGNKEWDRNFGGVLTECSYSVQQTADGGYIIAGVTYSYGAGEMDIWLIKTDSEGRVGIEEAEVEVITPEPWLDVIPNPFTTPIIIRYELPFSAPVSLKIYDVSGRVVKDFYKIQDFKPGVYSVQWDGRDKAGEEVPSGVYFIQLKAGPFKKTRQVLLLR